MATDPAADRTAITDLVHEYAHRIDRGDLDGVGELFAHATYRTAGVDEILEGAEQVAAAQRRLVRLYDGTPRTQHVVTGIIVELGPGADAATARSYVTVLHAPPGAAPAVILTGRYHDRFERLDGAWCFVDRLIHLDLVGDLATHLHLDRLGAMAPGAGDGTDDGTDAGAGTDDGAEAGADAGAGTDDGANDGAG